MNEGKLNLYWFGPPFSKFRLLVLLVLAIWLASSDHDASKQCDAIWGVLFQHSLHGQQEHGFKQARSSKHIYIYTSTIINLRQWIRKFEGYSYSCVSFTKWILFFIWVYLVRMEGSIQHIRTMLINQDDVLRIPLHGDMYSVYNLELFHVLVKKCYEMPSTWK